MKAPLVRTLIVSSLLWALGCTTASAEPNVSQLYQKHCSSCHGSGQSDSGKAGVESKGHEDLLSGL